MILENNDDLVIADRIIEWLDEKGMTVDYFLDTLKNFGFSFPIRVSNLIEISDDSFKFLCSSKNDSSYLSRWISMSLKGERTITLSSESLKGTTVFWERLIEF